MGERENAALKIFRCSLPEIKRKFMLEKVYLFGSCATGEALASSDLDVVMVSERFGDMKFIDRISTVLELIDPSVEIDLLCYTPEEFNRKKEEIGIVSESLKYRVDL